MTMPFREAQKNVRLLAHLEDEGNTDTFTGMLEGRASAEFAPAYQPQKNRLE
jgi:hypothetical protein